MSTSKPTSTDDLLKQFHRAMVGIYQRSLKETGVNHSMFLRMIHERGAHATALHLVHASSPSAGYTDLYVKGRLDLTVEALVLQAQWDPIVEEETKSVARKRLAEYHFDFQKHGL